MDPRPPLRAGLRSALPSAVSAGRPTAIFVHGWAACAGGRPQTLEVVASGEPVRPIAFGMPSPGLAVELGVAAEDAARAYFWAVVPVRPGSGTLELEVVARLRGGAAASAHLGTVAIEDEPPAKPPAGASGRVAICMATHEPPPHLLARQLESLRAQTFEDWICLISDDASGPQRFGELERLTRDDDRFIVSRAPTRLGAYENFHRALSMAPADAEYVALCDQDDRWLPHKLTTLVQAIGDAQLVFSDMRVVTEAGVVISDTYWTDRVPNHGNFASLLLGNTVTGAASMLRRDALDEALPLPPRFGNLFHDHWLALVARARGEIAYVTEPLYDYVQHDEAVIGHAGANRGVVGGGVLRRLAALRGREPGRLRGSWREIYFCEYCRLRLSAAVLETRLGERLGRAERHALRLASGGLRTSPWLAARQVRRLRANDTQGSEAAMLRALAWEGLMRVSRHDALDDADLPPDIPGAAARSG